MRPEAWVFLLHLCQSFYVLSALQWYGPQNQYLCHCHATATCTEGVCSNPTGCVSDEWFGQRCHLRNLLASLPMAEEDWSDLTPTRLCDKFKVTNGAEHTIQIPEDSPMHHLPLYLFFFQFDDLAPTNLSVRFKMTPSETTHEADYYQDGMNTAILKLHSILWLHRDESITVLGNMPEMACRASLGLGRNVALRQETEIYMGSDSNAQKAVDGTNKQDGDLDLCVKIDGEGDDDVDNPNRKYWWKVTFTHLFRISTIRIYRHASDAERSACLGTPIVSMLGTDSNLTLTEADTYFVDGQSKMVYVFPNSSNFPVQTVEVWSRFDTTSPECSGPAGAPKRVSHLCEVQVFGFTECSNQMDPRCQTSCDHCPKGRCDPDWGCLHGCTLGNHELCHECPLGQYGQFCKNNCSTNCKFENCDSYTGACIGGCKAGYQPSSANCSQRCPRTYFGINCTYPCGHCSQQISSDRFCHHVTGNCDGDCQFLYIGDNCDKVLYMDRFVIFASLIILSLVLILIGSCVTIKRCSQSDLNAQVAGELQEQVHSTSQTMGSAASASRMTSRSSQGKTIFSTGSTVGSTAMSLYGSEVDADTLLSTQAVRNSMSTAANTVITNVKSVETPTHKEVQFSAT